MLVEMGAPYMTSWEPEGVEKTLELRTNICVRHLWNPLTFIDSLKLTSRNAMIVSRMKLLEMAVSDIVMETALGTGEISGQKLTSKWREELRVAVGFRSQESIWTE